MRKSVIVAVAATVAVGLMGCGGDVPAEPTYHFDASGEWEDLDFGPQQQNQTAPDAGVAPIRRAFVTAMAYRGNLAEEGRTADGLLGADNLCTLAAQAANLGGTWRAWLSDSRTNAADRLADVGPWYLVDKTTKVFNNRANLMTMPLSAIRMDEQGRELPAEATKLVWTGTQPNGRASADTCTDWRTESTRGTVGDAQQNTELWTETQADYCDQARRLYCLEQ